MPAAAAVPLSNEVAVAQNGPCMENVAISPRLTAASAGTMECVYAAINNAAAAAKAEPARCQRRSPVWSECIPTSTIAMAVAT
jgi:hypothetical protein